MSLAGRVALVTGGATGLMAHLCRALAADGVAVAVHCFSSEAQAAPLAAELRGAGVSAAAFRADLRDPTQVNTLAREVRAALGPVSLLLHGASPFARQPLLAASAEVLTDTFDLELAAPVLLAQALEVDLRATRGQVLLMNDLSGLQGWRPYGAHSVGKAGARMITRLLALELAPEVRVNGIAAGRVQGEDAGIGRIPLGRAGLPDDVIAAMRYLLSADYVTGEILTVDGGRLARSV